MSKLTDEHIAEIFSVRRGAVIESHLLRCARAIESAACAERDKRIAELERQLEEARKDAERYRWLRVQSNRDASFAVIKDAFWRGPGDCDPDFYDSPKELDAAIDTAMQKGQS